MIRQVRRVRTFIDDFTIPPKDGVLTELALSIKCLRDGLIECVKNLQRVCVEIRHRFQWLLVVRGCRVNEHPAAIRIG